MLRLGRGEGVMRGHPGPAFRFLEHREVGDPQEAEALLPWVKLCPIAAEAATAQCWPPWHCPAGTAAGRQAAANVRLHGCAQRLGRSLAEGRLRPGDGRPGARRIESRAPQPSGAHALGDVFQLADLGPRIFCAASRGTRRILMIPPSAMIFSKSCTPPPPCCLMTAVDHAAAAGCAGRACLRRSYPSLLRRRACRRNGRAMSTPISSFPHPDDQPSIMFQMSSSSINDISTSIWVNSGLAIQAQIFVAEAADDLEVAIHAGDHEQLLRRSAATQPGRRTCRGSAATAPGSCAPRPACTSP